MAAISIQNMTKPTCTVNLQYCKPHHPAKTSTHTKPSANRNTQIHTYSVSCSRWLRCRFFPPKAWQQCWHFCHWCHMQSEIASSPLPRSLAITPTQGPIPTDKTKCRNRKSHMTPLYSENRLTHKQPVQTGQFYPIMTQCIPALPKHNPESPHISYLHEKSVVFLVRKLAAILWKLAQKKRGTPLIM